MTRLELRHLQCFAAVAEELHFGRAAATLGLGQPLVSLSIQRLERAVGVPLLIRRPTVQLTVAGEAMLDYVRRALTEMTSGFATVQELVSGEQGELVLGFPNWIAATPLPIGIACFRGRFPKLRLSYIPLSSREQLQRLQDRSIDLAFVREPELDETLFVAAPLLRERFVVALPTSHPLAAKKSASLSELKGDEFLLFPRESAPGFHDLITRTLQRCGIDRQPTASAADWFTILSLVRIGTGVTIIPASLSELKLQGLHFMELENVDTVSTICAVRLRTREQVSVCRLIDALERFGEQQATGT